MPRRGANPPVLKKFGQHFLNDRSALSDIADAAMVSAEDIVIEVGPGRGALTDELLKRAGRVIAVEIDHQLAENLRAKYSGEKRIEIVERDILDVSVAQLVDGPFVVVGNVPYYITTPILFHALEPPLPVRCVFLVQREVAERIVSPPGSREYGALSVNVQAIAHAEIVRMVPPRAFSPPPKVDSAVVRITPLQNPIVPPNEIVEFRKFVLAIFGMRRKQIGNVLRSVRRISIEDSRLILESQSIDPEARPETLSPNQFVEILRAMRQ
ncbi:MAG TPA: 16S rRNA (adenine(1518)-N(6)/adenine(1519)-N(6))-dimethyltransferase RsmA [Gemmatimonadaceae bacterium]|nr:16S rRNA (adenine(1518)-N(6)/adenine(1519)-N(6))-dimethyltransferase RsmA [Gemmatimonadaceae bacterium]